MAATGSAQVLRRDTVMETPITFAVAVSSRDICEHNLMASPCLSQPNEHQLVFQENFSSAAKAYNHAIERAANDLIVFAHQDVFLPEGWLSHLRAALDRLADADPNWGVLGCWGTKHTGEGLGHLYTSGWGMLGEPFEDPQPVQTLDEFVLILRKSSGLRFDETLPHFHLYGTDICMRAASRGLRSYAISAFCVHNTAQIRELPEEFYQCYRHVKRVWRRYLPIQTPCIRITRFNAEVYRRKAEKLYFSLFTERPLAKRVADPRQLLEHMQSACR